MFEEEQQKINDYKKTKTYLNIVWVAVKLTIAYVLVTYVDYGIFVVIGYVLFAIESTTGTQFINAKEVDLQLNILNERIIKLEDYKKTMAVIGDSGRGRSYSKL